MANVGKPIMAGACPTGPLTDPALKEAYKGCSIYSYYDQSRRRQYVMFDKNTRVRHGTKEAQRARNKTNMELMYTLQHVRSIDEDG
jgi:hypothetical protein